MRSTRMMVTMVTRPINERGRVDLAKVEEGVNRPKDLVAGLAVEAGQVPDLAQDGQHAEAAQETGHDRVGHKADQEPQLEQAKDEHEEPDQQSQHDQVAQLFLRGHSGQGLTRGQGRGAGRVDVHEHRGGDKGGDGGAHDHGVEAKDGVDAGQHAVGQPRGHIDHGHHQAGNRVVQQRLFRNLESNHLYLVLEESRLVWPPRHLGLWRDWLPTVRANLRGQISRPSFSSDQWRRQRTLYHV